MKIALHIWPVFSLLCVVALGAEATGNTPASKPWDETQWSHLVRNTKTVPESDLLSSRAPGAATGNQHLHAAEAECAANAVALLNVNALLPDSATTAKVGTKAAWNGKTAVFLLRGYSDGRDFLFLCLVDKDGTLERTRLVRPELRDKKLAVEIDAAQYTYGAN